MITDPLFYSVAVPAVLLIGLSKGGFAGPLALLGVPLMSLVVPPIQAAGILLPILVVMDLTGLWAWRHHRDVTLLRWLLPAAIAGIAIGWLTAAWVTDAHVRLIVGLVALGFALDYALGDRLRQRSRVTTSAMSRDVAGKSRDWCAASVWGAVSGFTSFVAHAGGPPLAVYLLPKRLDKAIYAGTSVVFFAVVNQIKLVPYFFLGQLSPQNLSTSLILLPLAPLATLAGAWLVRRIAQEAFYRLTYAAIFVISLKLIWDGIAAAWS